MSEHFQPGDMVECVQISCAYGPELSPIEIGEIYTVSAVSGADLEMDDGLIVDTTALDLVGREHPEFAYLADDFRLIYRPDPKLIERLTAEPVVMPPPALKPARVNEDA